ncbi:bifunctional DNA primase/polymerase [Streptomyces goshikiensis]|uniref:bifunctional DNA primase/polymerase n=1 Tax=Streptomyces goshikiensis TaxID=1942 RepID=UPI0037A021A7
MTIEAPILAAQQVPTRYTDRAAFFADLGFGVVPMPTNSKRPIFKGWPDLAMTSAEEVEIYWRSFTRDGWQNIALTLAGWVVVDVDPKNGGTESLANLEAEYGPLPLTRTHHTASGRDSLHFIYQVDPARPLKPAPLNPAEYPGIDIKTGRGALIVAPGSVIGGRRYEVVSGREPVVAPPWLSEIQQGARHRRAPLVAPRTPSGASAGQPDGTSLAALRALPPDHPGRDNSWLCQVAGKLARKHRNDHSAYLRELTEIDSESEVPHSKDAFMKTAESIWSREHAKPLPPGDAQRLREIKVRDGAQLINDISDALNDGAIPDLYTQAGTLVLVADVHGDPNLPIGEIRKGTRRVDAPTLGAQMARHVNVYTTSTDGDGNKTKKRTQPHQPTLQQVLAGASWPGVPPLFGITRVPVLRADGTILNEAGYDRASGVYFDPRHDFSNVALDPTPDQMQAARTFLLDELLADFPFSSQADRANYVALQATPPLRRFISGNVIEPTPLGLINAHTAGTGKTLLADLIRETYGGAKTDFVDDENELRKIVTSLLRDKVGSVCLLDNVGSGHQVRSATLSALLTSSVWTGRVLGQSQTVALVNDQLWMATGNNVRLGGDNASRTLMVNVDAGIERPELRGGFRIPNLDTWIKSSANQAKIVRAMLVLGRAWVMGGAPTIDTRMRGYSTWASAMAGFLDFHEIPGFLGNADKVAEADTERQSWGAFLATWHEKFGEKPMGVKDLMHTNLSVGDGWGDSFILVDAGSGRELSVVKAGNKLREKVGVPIDGLVLRSEKPGGPNSKKSNVYYVEPHKPGGGI